MENDSVNMDLLAIETYFYFISIFPKNIHNIRNITLITLKIWNIKN